MEDWKEDCREAIDFCLSGPGVRVFLRGNAGGTAKESEPHKAGSAPYCQ